MLIPKPLVPQRLQASLEQERLPWSSSNDIPLPGKNRKYSDPFQPRAMQALDLALEMGHMDYHIYLSAEPELAPDQTLSAYLQSRAKDWPTPPDLVYVQNFEDPDKPRLLILPSGFGRKFKQALQEFIQTVTRKLKDRLESGNFSREQEEMQTRYQQTKTGLLSKMSKMAAHMGFSLHWDENGGVSIGPANANSARELDGEAESGMFEKSAHLAKSIAGMLKELNNAENSLMYNERDLEERAMGEILDDLFKKFGEKILKTCQTPEMRLFLKSLKDDIQKNFQLFQPQESPRENEPSFFPLEQPNPVATRYNVNVMVDNSDLKGAPVIREENPSTVNLLGCMERESEMGALLTNFSLIRSGSLHRANGGFLILSVQDLLNNPGAWEGLMRALKARSAHIEDGNEFMDAPLRAKSLHPDAIPLKLIVILTGNEELYEILLENDERFARLFRLKAHMTDYAPRNSLNIKHFLSRIASIIQRENLLPFDASALAWTVDLASRLCEDQRKLSLQFSRVQDYMLEACALARLDKKEAVSADILEKAYNNRFFRGNMLEDIIFDEYERDLIKISTTGSAVGQINGLTVICNGDLEFGLPQKISCAIGAGHEGIIDLEREADLGGPIHTKAMMILKSYLTSHFAHKKPIVLSGSLYFEQNYACIEGDSASGAELAVIISALANAPLRLDLAFTGAVSQTGSIMAVGGVSKKIEGFFKLCKRQGLTGSQGVIIPADNVEHLMLSQEIIENVREMKFFIYPVKTVEEALLLLTGMQPGKRRKNGGYTTGSLFALADARLEQLGAAAQHSFKNSAKKNS